MINVLKVLVSQPPPTPHKPKILVIAFSTDMNDPDKDNTSERTLAALPDRHPDVSIVKCTLPVEYKASFLKLQAALKTHKPDFTIILGESPYRGGSIIMENHANSHSSDLDNLDLTPRDYEVPDQNREISTLNPALMRIVELASNAHLKTTQGRNFDFSADAGIYLCNDVFYHALSLQKNNGRTMFLHVTQSDAVERLFTTLPAELENLNQEIVPLLHEDIHYLEKGDHAKPFEDLRLEQEVLCAQYEKDQQNLPQEYAKVVMDVITNVAKKPAILSQHTGYTYQTSGTAPAPAYVPPDYLGELTPPATTGTGTAPEKSAPVTTSSRPR